jgi:hypothetical protein
MARTTTVTHPDGTVSKRTSQNRVYTYAVEIGPAEPAKVASDLDEKAYALDRKADRIDAALTDPRVKIASRGFRSAADPDLGYQGVHVYHNFQGTLVGTDTYTWCDSAGMTQHGFPEQVTEPVLDYLIRAATKDAAYCRDLAAKWRADADALHSGDLTPLSENQRTWGVGRWSSRYDLARKAADGSEFDWARRDGSTIRVVECQEK